MDFGKLAMFHARSRESEPAIAFTGGVATYKMLAAAVLSATDRIRATGLAPGALVAIDVRNPFHHTVLILALDLCGMPSASVQTSFNVEMSGLKPAAILVDGNARHPDGLNLIAVDESWFQIDPAQPVDYARLMALPGFPDDNSLIRVVFSSGTTGVPKSTGFTAGNLEKRLAHASFVLGGGGISGIRAMCLMGFSTYGGYGAAIGALASGGVACFAQQPSDVMHVVRMFNVDLLILAVVQLRSLLDSLGDARPPGCLQTVSVGGSKMPVALLREAQARLCPNITFGYGSTEAGMLAHAPGSQLADLEGSAGYIVPWATIEAIDDEGRTLPAGQEGLLRVKSTELAHYVVDQPDNQLVFRDGWFYPGDIGSIRADGLVTITGRAAEVINRGGSIVAPDLVEQVLTMHDSVAEAVAFGVPTRTGIDEIWAAVVAPERFNEAELLYFCREKLSDKAPGVIRRIDAIPRTDSGKPKRRQVRDQLMAARPAQ